MTTDRKRAFERVATDRASLCRATNKRGEPCGKKAARDGLCLVHSGEQDMKAIGREGGRATPKAKRREADGEREGYRDHLRRELDPSEITQAIKTGLASPNERDRLAAAKLALGELYEPAVERERENEADAAAARAEFLRRVEEISARRLVERGLTHPGTGSPFEGVVMFELREVVEWAAAWTSATVTVGDVTCSACGKAGVRAVKVGETVDGGPLYCDPCEKAKAEAEASSPAPAADPPPVPPVEESVEAATWPRRSLT